MQETTVDSYAKSEQNSNRGAMGVLVWSVTVVISDVVNVPFNLHAEFYVEMIPKFTMCSINDASDRYLYSYFSIEFRDVMVSFIVGLKLLKFYDS